MNNNIRDALIGVGEGIETAVAFTGSAILMQTAIKDTDSPMPIRVLLGLIGAASGLTTLTKVGSFICG